MVDLLGGQGVRGNINGGGRKTGWDGMGWVACLLFAFCFCLLPFAFFVEPWKLKSKWEWRSADKSRQDRHNIVKRKME